VKSEEGGARLTPENTQSLDHGNGAAVCGIFRDNHQKGVYACGMRTSLFRSEAKFDSCPAGQVFQPVADENIGTETDLGHRLVEAKSFACAAERTWAMSLRGSPAPTDLRYCINSASLIFRRRIADFRNRYL
jgi:peptide-methionine (R)-S-oxide reductase